MNFLSVEFAILFVVLLTVLCIVRSRECQKAVLLAASYVFYALGDVKFLGLLIFISVLMWILGNKIALCGKKRYLILGVGVNLAVLGIFKYSNFFVDSFARLLGKPESTIKILLPLGISFYIFQSISYIADVYTRKIAAQGMLDTMLYIGFFPQIVSGPIVKAHDFFPQLRTSPQLSWEKLSWGIQRFALGVFKKTVIADRLGVCVNSVYSAPMAFSGLSILAAVFSYALQIYYDFSGYSDMAIAVAHILGFDVGENFNLPYLAKNPSDFWRRWHISLSSWFRDYVYIPLGGNRKGKIRTYANIFITMILSGLWHGASWAFVVWGGIHASASAVHKLFCDTCVRGKKREKKQWEALKIVINTLTVAGLWIPFRTNDVADAITIIMRIFTWADGICYLYVFTLIFSIMLFFVEIFAVVRNRGNDVWKPLNLSKHYNKFVFCTFLLLTAVFAYLGDGAFIYEQF